MRFVLVASLMALTLSTSASPTTHLVRPDGAGESESTQAA